MKNSLFGLLISILLVQGSKASPEKCTKLDTECASYCLQELSPILDHAKALQNQVRDFHNLTESLTELNNLEKVETRIIEIESKLRRYEEFMAGFQNVERLAKLNCELKEEKWQIQIDSLKFRIDFMTNSESTNNQQIGKGLNDITFMKKFKKIGKKYYYIEEDEQLNWFQAVHKCLALGGHLASIKNQAEFEAITAELNRNKHYWLAFNDLGTDGVYLSIADGLPVNYFNWHKDNPGANNTEYCAELWYNDYKHLMNDSNCSNKEFFICEPHFQ